MARQAGPLYFTGTVGDLVFYKLGEHYYMRQKGDYNTKALQKPGAMPLMQLKQQEFGRASKLASEVYRQLPRAYKKHGLFGQFTKAARQLLKQGMSGDDVKASLAKQFLPAPAEASPENADTRTHSSWEVSTEGLLHRSPAANSIHQKEQTVHQQLPRYVYTATDSQKRPEFYSSLSIKTQDD